ncbi:MAG: hypothetical protein PHR92_11315 [Lachnospiraceae bacterium]|nr:hypothetical protein [Lachnospiraceae bacterium]
MKKRTMIGVTLSVLCILALIGLGIFLFLDYRSVCTGKYSSIEEETSFFGLEEDADKKSIANAESECADEQTAAACASPLPEHHIIFVGDSRTVGMGNAQKDTSDPCTYIGESGEGYAWFMDLGLSQMEEAMDTWPDSPIVMNLGVNDMSEIKKYLDLYQSFSDSYPGHTFYFLSVNPVTDQAAHVTNSEIGEFNARLQEAFPDQYLDCYTYMMVKEFESVDGVHYSEATYCMIHDFVVRQIFS